MLAFKPSQWSHAEGDDRKELYPFPDLGYHQIGKEELGISTRELTIWRVATRTFGNRRWSQCSGHLGKVELVPSVVRTGELPKRTCGPRHSLGG